MKIVLRGSTSVTKKYLEDDEEDINSSEVFQMIAAKNDELQELNSEAGAFNQFCDDDSELAASILSRIQPGG